MLIPDGPQAMTSEWLTQALRQTGTITSATVSSFQTQAIGEEGEGMSGQMARVQLSYDHNEPTAPQSLIAKFHSADPQIQTMYNSLGLYESEFRFYKQIAPKVDIPTPRFYYGDFHESGLTVLLLEDLAPARSPGLDINSSQVELAIRQIAKLHAYWWEHPQFVEIMGKEDAVAIQNGWNFLQSQVQKNWQSFLELTKDDLPQEMIGIGQRIVNNWTAIGDQLHYHSPRTFIHGDFGPDNFFFSTAEGGAPFTIIDWQLSSRGRGAYDVGILLGGMPIDQRRKTEQDLLKIYYQILIENGVKGYSFEQCLVDYRRTMLESFARLVLVMRAPFPGEDLNRYQATDHKFREVDLPRRCAAILDLDAEKLIPNNSLD